MFPSPQGTLNLFPNARASESAEFSVLHQMGEHARHRRHRMPQHLTYSERLSRFVMPTTCGSLRGGVCTGS